MRWKINNCSDFGIREKLNDQSLRLHSIVERILVSRGVKNSDELKSFIFPNYERDSLNPFLFVDMQKAVERIRNAKERKEKVLVFGDYDADGITATTVVKETLNELGIESGIYIPDKEKEGYGLNKEVIRKSKEKGISLIITVDCGISNFEEVEYANEIGIDVIVTDHHHIPETVPNAFAIINPRMKNSNYPFDDLAGVGVAFKLAQAVFEKLLPHKKEQVKWLLDLVAIGTIADCVGLRSENRMLVKYGLIVLSKTRREGFQEMFKTGRILIDENNVPDTQKISFQVAPRINAASRMSHAKLAYDLISEKDRVKARIISLEIEEQNKSRQKMTEEIVKEVELMINTELKDDKVIFAVSEHFPIGITGLVAGRITGKFSKPCAVITRGEQMCKGSFRSIPDVNIIEAISKCSHLLEKFGGHSQAAGVSVKNENIDEFKNQLNLIVEEELKGKNIEKSVDIDEIVLPVEVDFNLIEDIEKLKPFGVGNLEPVFLMEKMIVQELKWVGNGEKHLKMFVRPSDNSPKIFEAIGFNLLDSFGDLKMGDIIDLVFNLQKDEWNGNRKMQFKIIDLKKKYE